MHHIEQIYINGEFVTPHGTERFDLFNPARARVMGQLRLADAVDAERAIAAAKAAFPAWSQTRKQERIAALQRMQAAVAARHDDLLEAVIEEYGAPASRSAWMASYPAEAIGQAIAALEAFEFVMTAGAARVEMTPLGVAGLITPWNSDAGFICGKLAAALAAGCTAVIKPSEMSALQTQIVTEALHAADLPPGVFNIVTGRGDTVGETISRHPLVAKISCTGSTQTGKAILRNAAENFTRVTLELGGKSPAIVSADVPLKDAAERIAFGKALNAGQTCVAPDYVLVPEDRVDGFVAAYTQAVRGFYPTLADNPDYTAIINERQLARLNAYVKDATDKGATLVPLYDQGQARRMAHSLLLNVSDEMTVMQDEIFGPVLPIVPYRGIDQAFAYINQRPRPLALYYFGYNKAEQNRVLHETHSGGVCLNDTLLHVAQDDMPFGGIGPSGMGHYHGHEGFLTFSKAKGVLIKQRLNAAKLIYPPYGKAIQKLIQKLFVR